jgi:hypothetical protein
MKGGDGADSFINKMLNVLKVISNIFVPLLIILLFFGILVIHLTHMRNFIISRWNKYTSSVKTDSPYNESLNITHCDINNSGDIVYNDTVLTLFMIFTILLILFWYNYIVGLFSRTTIANEIKILGYNKYYNENITNKTEYSIIYILSIYILITFIYYGYMIYDSYMGSNYNEIEIYKNIKLIDKTIEDNIICKLYNDLIDQGTKGKSLNEILKDFFKENNSIAGKAGDSDIIEKRLKVVITCVLATDISFAKINQENNICTDNTYNLKCLYRKLYNIKNNQILPDYKDINLINVLANPSYLTKPGETIDLKSLNVNENELKAAYEKIQNNITSYSREINKNNGTNVFYYKIGLMSATVSSLIFSVFAILYFAFFEFVMLNKSINTVYIGVDYFIKKYAKLIVSYVIALVVILLAFIINF